MTFSKTKPTDLWATPVPVFNAIQNYLQIEFALDACADELNYKCDNYYDEEANGLLSPWIDNTFCNPPYSNIPPWCDKALEECIQEHDDRLTNPNGIRSVLLLRSDTSTKWFHKYAHNEWVNLTFLKPRIQFRVPVGLKKSSNPHGSVLLDFNPRGLPEKPKYIDWRDYLS